jgi:uncharacterized protein YndB with AHSA1/START domain
MSASQSSSAAAAGAPALVLTRTFDAPRALVFEAWTDPDQLMQWWGPHGFTTPRCEVDLRPGGAIRMEMRAPDGTVYPMAGTYREIVPPELLVFTSGPLDPDGKLVFEATNTVRFTESAGRTTVTLEVRIASKTPGADKYLQGMEAGWSQSLDRLDGHFAQATDRELITMRMFDAPRELVWKAWTDPAHIAKWWGPDGFTNTIHQMDVRPGGKWHFIMHGPTGIDYPNEIVFSEVLPPKRLVYTHVGPRFEATITFDDMGGKTVLTMRGRFLTVEDYQQAVKTFGAIEGAKQTLGRLGEYLKTM